MPREVPADISYGALPDVVGRGAYDRGVAYARGGAVLRALWSSSANALLGTVRGSGARQYTTTARFTEGSPRVFDRGECSCPVRVNCKHVVALVMVGAGHVEPEPEPEPTSAPQRWERSLETLLKSPQASRTQRVPLALELSFSPTSSLQARVVRPGKREAWVAGDLSWSRLAHLHIYGQYVTAHVRLLQELYALSQAHGLGYHSYPYNEQKYLELSEYESPRLWPVLADAQRCGLRLVHRTRQFGELDPIVEAAACIDMTCDAESGNLRMTPRLRVDAEVDEPVPLLFIGAPAHGLVYAERAELGAGFEFSAGRIRLASLTDSVAPELQELLLLGRRLEIPADQRRIFDVEFFPKLRHMATVVSSDESYTPPEISAPTLVLDAQYGADHDLQLAWAWLYHLGGSSIRTPGDAEAPTADPGFRDPQAERAIIDSLDAGVERFGLATSRPRRLGGPVRLTGIDTMRFTTEVLPLLQDLPGVCVEAGDAPDYREAGDSLRIGISADDAGERDWFDLGVSITVEGREVPFTQVFAALARDESYMLLDDGAYFSLQKPELQSLRRLIEEARALQDSPSDSLRISRFQAGLWEELSSLGVVDRQAAAWQRQVGGLLAAGPQGAQALPAGLHAQLRPYQSEGFSWLSFLWQHRLGGILADDMGLGKTLQTLALISHAKQDDPACPPFLIVAPASVVPNWVSEAERFTPGCGVVQIGETLTRRGQTLAEVAAGADLVVTSYTLFRLDIDAYAEAEWSGFVLDEAQFAKNHKSKVYQCARQVPTQFKLAITGTPMENNLMELWSLLSITAPGLFPNPTRFRDYYARPIEKSGDTELLAQLRRRIKPLVKRRTKEQVAADLPAKQEQVLDVELHPRHRTIYQRHLQRERQKVLRLLEDVNGNRFTILRSLTLLRQLSLHPGLVDDEHADVPCAKIDALFEHLREVVDGGHRALVFSQFTGFLGQVRARLEAAGVAYSYLDGKTRDRAEVITRFKDGVAPVFLISLKAGGFGLNLTEADYCFLLDPWWNPATEAQAVDRTHRIGQTRNVMVYRLISADTIEQKVMALKTRKAELFSSVMEDGNAFGGSLDADDIRALFE